MTPEKKVQNDIIKVLQMLSKQHLLYYERRQAMGIGYKKGICDLYAIINGIHVEIEVKAKGGKLSTMQEKWRDKCAKLNILWVCCDCRDDLINFLEANFF